MNIYSIPPLFSSIWALFLGILTLKSKNPKVKHSFPLVALSVFWWLFGYFEVYSASTYSTAFYWVRILHIGVVCIPATSYHFAVSFLNLERKKVFVVIIYLISFIFVLLTQNNLFISGLYKYFWGYHTKVGPLYNLFLLFFVVVMARVLIFLYSYYRRFWKEGLLLEANRVKYIFVAYLISIIAAIDFLPHYGIEFYPIGFIFIVLHALLSVYAILKYRAMDINLLFKRYVTLYFLCVLTGVLIFLPFTFLFKRYFLGVLGLIILIVSSYPYIYPRLLRVFEPFVDVVLLKGKYLYWKKLTPSEFLKMPAYTTTELAYNLCGALLSILNLEGVSFFLYKKDRKQFRPLVSLGFYQDLVGSEPLVWVNYEVQHPFIKYISQNNRIITKEDNLPSLISEELRKLYTEITLPLFFRKSLKAFVLLPKKEDHNFYHPQDIQRLKEVKEVVENHLEHTIFMEERTLYSYKLAHDMKNLVEKTLEPMVEDIVKEPGKERLKSLQEIVSFLKSVHYEHFDMNRIYQAILLENYPTQRFDYKDILIKVKEATEPFASKKGLYLQFNLPSRLPPIQGNPPDIYKLLYNLITNSLKFTQTGGVIVEVSLLKEEKRVLTQIKDTGAGIPQERLDNIFEPFFQIKDEEKTEGVGLGLTIVRDIIEANKGKIWVESEIDKGTTFYFTLPQAK